MEFKHISVMLNECIQNLNIRPDGVYIDGTLGGGGHSFEILKKLTSGKLICFDKDQNALDFCKEKFKDFSCVTYIHDDFKNFSKYLKTLGETKVDGILLDLGVSSYQIDTQSRGFSYNLDAPLDMRMNEEQALDAWKVVNTYPESKLVEIFSKYGEEPFSKRIANAIVKKRKEGTIETTLQLVKIIESIVPQNKVQGHPAKRIFQAIRIEVNSELTKLYECIVEMARSLNPGGRMCVLTFHSLEDRIVKDAFSMLSSDCVCDKRMPVCTCHHKKEVVLLNKKPVVASKEEQNQNPRSHSAKLRAIEKI